MAACTLSLLSLIMRWIFLDTSVSMPLRTLITCLTLSPPIFCTSPVSRKRTSTLRLVSLLRRISSIWVSWNSALPIKVISLSLSSIAAGVPLKSKRVAISLAVLSTAFLTSTRLGSQTVSNEGMADFQKRCNERIDAMLVEKNAPLEPWNTFHIVAKAHSLVRVSTCADVQQVLADPNCGSGPKFVLGGGSNIVLTGDVK